MLMQDAPGSHGFNSFLKELPAANRVLELGCFSGELGRAYKGLHASAHWTGVGERLGLLRASAHLDRIVFLDLEVGEIDLIDEAFDLIVIWHLLERLRDPQRLLASARRLVAKNGCLVCCIANAANIDLINRALLGDLTYDQNGPFDTNAVRLFSPSSAIKTLLDQGWLPNLVASRQSDAQPDTFEPLDRVARGLGVSADAFARNALMTDMFFECSPITNRRVVPCQARPRISVVVPVTNQLQFEMNIARSPGIVEMEADLIQIRDATSAADGYERGRLQAAGEWIVYCHQDIYMPKGSGLAILAELALVDEERKREQIIGVIGLAALTPERLANGGTQFSGMIIDRVMRLDYAPTDDAVSIDESMIILHRDCVHSIDPDMGWHFWATDLIISATRRSALPPCKVISVPIFHNSLTGWTFSEDFQAAIARMFDKYPEKAEIVSLCGTWTRPNMQSVVAS